MRRITLPWGPLRVELGIRRRDLLSPREWQQHECSRHGEWFYGLGPWKCPQCNAQKKGS